MIMKNISKEEAIRNFNPQQKEAICAPVNKDILISAGAGSGKTKTLSERVYWIIKEHQVEPSSLLVLTFTDNAAHEMKTRIISRFQKNKDDEEDQVLAERMKSCHIQTFDSFNQYLVTQYAGTLGMPDKLSVADPMVLSVKENEFLDQILNEYIEKEHDRVLLSFRKFNSSDLNSTKKVILDLYHQLDKLLPSEREDYITHYEERFLTDQKFNEFVGYLVKISKEKIEKKLRMAYFLQKHQEELNQDIDFNPSVLKNAFTDPVPFTLGIEEIGFTGPEWLNDLSEKLKSFLKLDGYDFIYAVQEFKNDKFVSKETKVNLLPKANSNQYTGLKDDERAAYDCLKNLFMNDKELNSVLEAEPSEEEAKRRYFSFKPDIELLLEIEEELRKRLMDYKKQYSCYTFGDIGNFALELLTEHEEVSKEIAHRFTYIMVDEYQDTNDFQELFLNSLLKYGSHLFCVGDAKQAIYAFRNSNVQLFRKREKEYEEGDQNKHAVIYMNRNYRSRAPLLHDINYIFDSYMTEDHGDIDYKKESEQLIYGPMYGQDVNKPRALTPEEDSDKYGVFRLTSVSGRKDDGYNTSEWEAKAIVDDIKKKVKSGYKVYDRDLRKERPCTYADFAILLRKKSRFQVFVQVFEANGIPLNNLISSDLKENDPVIVLQSLVGLLDALINNNKDIDINHLFASVARSYVCGYSDQQLYDILYEEKAEPGNKKAQAERLQRIRNRVMNDPIMVKLKDFASKHRSAYLPDTFLDLLDTFPLIENLYKIGSVEDNIAKIESIYELVEEQQNFGLGIADFVNLMKKVSKYSIDFTADSIFRIENAVDMMTIHASKGLEKHIVYMPVTTNALSGANNMNKPDYAFSKEDGIFLPSYDVEEALKSGKSLSPLTLPYKLYKEKLKNEGDIERDEHVRLFYVALTRAEDALIIVGDDPNEGKTASVKDKKKENLYGMLRYSPNFVEISSTYLKNHVSSAEYEEYQSIVKARKEFAIPLSYKDFCKDIADKEKARAAYELYLQIAGEEYEKFIDGKLTDKNYQLENGILSQELQEFEKKRMDPDFLSRFFAYDKYSRSDIRTYADLLEFLKKRKEEKLDEEDSDEEDDASEEESSVFLNKEEEPWLKLNEEDFRQFLNDYGDAVFSRNSEKLGLAESKKKGKDEEDRIFTEAMFPIFSYVFDGEMNAVSLSFHTLSFNDYTFKFNIRDFHDDASRSWEPSGWEVPVQGDGNYEYHVDDNDYSSRFAVRVSERASKKKELLPDEDNPSSAVMNFGTELHSYMENVNFTTRDVSFIDDPGKRNIIKKVLSDSFFDGITEDMVYKEYGYFDEDLGTTGFIDLLIKKDDKFIIVDYKTKRTDDEAYQRQLHIYKKNVMKLFNVPEEKISLYLFSLIDGVSQEVK